MKTTNRLFCAIVLILLFFSTSSFSQGDRPDYFSVTTMYWNKNYEGTMDEWKAMEKEYNEKVTSKNEHIMGSSYHTHLLTPNSNEVLYVQVYPTWADIDLAAARNAELEKEAWPDVDARTAFLKKLNSVFSMYHSDEIYATMPGAKLPKEERTKDMILYMRTNKMAYPKDGSDEEFNGFIKKMQDEVIMKNDYIKAYWPSMHAWGSDKRDFVEAFMIESLSDLEAMFDKNSELMKAAFTEEEGEALGKYYKGHGDAVYTYVKF